MMQMIDAFWGFVNEAYNNLGEVRDQIKIKNDDAAKAIFYDNFELLYEEIREKYMREGTDNLCRHKVAAVAIKSIVDAQLIYMENIPGDCIFIGLYRVAVNIGLSYMINRLNCHLAELKVGKVIERCTMPIAFSCDTPYIEIFARNLYYTKENNQDINVLDVADRLFLLEYITLQDNGIDPELLRVKQIKETTR